MKTLKDKIRKGGKKFLIGWSIWFIIKWSLVLFFGKSLLDLIR